jgi:hypothetical protein
VLCLTHFEQGGRGLISRPPVARITGQSMARSKTERFCRLKVTPVSLVDCRPPSTFPGKIDYSAAFLCLSMPADGRGLSVFPVRFPPNRNTLNIPTPRRAAQGSQRGTTGQHDKQQDTTEMYTKNGCHYGVPFAFAHPAPPTRSSSKHGISRQTIRARPRLRIHRVDESSRTDGPAGSVIRVRPELFLISSERLNKTCRRSAQKQSIAGVDFSETIVSVDFLTPDRGRPACKGQGRPRQKFHCIAALETFNPRRTRLLFGRGGGTFSFLGEAALLDGFPALGKPREDRFWRVPRSWGSTRSHMRRKRTI